MAENPQGGPGTAPQALPLISIVVPIFNHAQYVSECLDSLLAQRFQAMEIICVDDASTDPRIREILAEAARSPLVRCIFNAQNLGISATQNLAVSLAKADYVAFVDCDDRLPDNALEVMWQAIQDNDQPDYLFSDRCNMDATGKPLYEAIYGQVASGKGIARDLLDRMVASHLKVIRRAAYEQAGGCSNRYRGIQDWELALAISRFGRLVYVPQTLYQHRLHENSVTQSDRQGQALKSNLLRRHHLETLWRSDGAPTGEMRRFVLSDLAGKGWYCPEAVLAAWQAGAPCHLDARGPQADAAIEFLTDFNSYFDRIEVDRIEVACRVVGALWAPTILVSPLGQ